MKQLFSMSIDVTAVRFDPDGHSYPSRIAYEGRTFFTRFEQKTGRVCFADASQTMWLERRGQSWYMVSRLSA